MFLVCVSGEASSWPQFRGHNASGRAVGVADVPAEIGPESHVLWKTPLAAGHSSPVIIGTRIYLTGVRDEAQLVTICLDATSGQIVWEEPAAYTELELVNRTVGSYAQSTCAASEEHVVSFFGSAGLLCYDSGGRLLWRKEFEPFKNDDGAGSSPILAGDRVILNQDHDLGSFLTAISLADGNTIWRTERPEFIRGYATPVLWENSGETQIVIAGSLWVRGYALESGEQRWSARGLSWGVVATPVVGGDGTLFVTSLAAGMMEVNDRAVDFHRLDTDSDGLLSRHEFESVDAMQGFFTHFDRDKDGQVLRAEYDALRAFWEDSRDVLMAIRPGGAGDITDTHVVWSNQRAVPTVPSPLVYGDNLFVVKDGGVVHCVDNTSGQADRPRRVSARGNFYSSPVGAHGKIYLLSQYGELSVITAEREWREIASAKFDEEVFATPAIVDGRIYLRTAGHLYCFGYQEGELAAAGRDGPFGWLIPTVLVALLCATSLLVGYRRWIKTR